LNENQPDRHGDDSGPHSESHTPPPCQPNAASDIDSASVRRNYSTVRTNAGSLKRIAKWLVTALVVVGLAYALQQSLAQWQSETQKLDHRVADLQSQIDRLEASGTAGTDSIRRLRDEQTFIRSRIPTLGNLRWDLIGLAGVLYAVGLFPPAMMLHRVLRALGQRVSIGRVVAAQLIGHAGKYVPGKAMVVVIRVAILCGRDSRPITAIAEAQAVASDVQKIPATVCVFWETLMMMAVGAAVGGVVIIWLPVPQWMIAASITIAVVASLPTYPAVMRKIAAKIARAELPRHDGRDLALFASAWAWSLLSWVAIGAAFTLLLLAIPSLETPDAAFATATFMDQFASVYLLGTAAVAIAMVAGFVSLIPGGAGVRELVLTAIVAPQFGPVHAILSAIAARLLFIVVEALLAAAVNAALKFQAR